MLAGWVVNLANSSETVLGLKEVVGQVVVAGLATRGARWRGLQFLEEMELISGPVAVVGPGEEGQL